MKFKKLLGIFFFLTLITTTVFGSLAENPRQGFDGFFTGLHQGVTLSKAATAPGLLACFLESSRQVFLLAQGGKELHHLLPQAEEFADFFRKAGLNIEEFKVLLDKAAHRLKPNGVHTGSENWNKLWRQFKELNPNATKQQILDQLEIMRKKFGI